MDERTFETAAQALLSRFSDELEAGLGDELDLELRGGVLIIELGDRRQFIVSKHAPTREIWLSSPVSGAHHFAWREGTWRSTRGTETLGARLIDDLRATGIPEAANLSLA